MVERFHRVLKERLMARDLTRNWMSHLPMVLLGIRSSIREDGDISPAHLVYGVPLRLPGQMLCGPSPSDRLPLPSSFAADLEKSLAVSAPIPVVFHGSQPVQIPQSLSKATAVYVRVEAVRPPLQRPYEGPFPVISRTDKTFCLRRNGKDWVVSVDRLKAAASSFPLTHLPSSPPVEDDADDDTALQRSLSSPSDLGVIGPPAPAPASAPAPAPPPAAAPQEAPDVRAAFDVPAGDVIAPDAPVAPAPAAGVSPLRTRSGRASVPPQRYQA